MICQWDKKNGLTKKEKKIGRVFSNQDYFAM